MVTTMAKLAMPLPLLLLLSLLLMMRHAVSGSLLDDEATATVRAPSLAAQINAGIRENDRVG